MPRGKNKNGFTIVELLAVIGAISILLGILLVGLQSASRMSRNVQSMSRLKQIHIGWTTYANAYEDRLLPGYIEEEVQDLRRHGVRSALLPGLKLCPGSIVREFVLQSQC